MICARPCHAQSRLKFTLGGMVRSNVTRYSTQTKTGLDKQTDSLELDQEGDKIKDNVVPVP